MEAPLELGGMVAATIMRRGNKGRKKGRSAKAPLEPGGMVMAMASGNTHRARTEEKEVAQHASAAS